MAALVSSRNHTIAHQKTTCNFCIFNDLDIIFGFLVYKTYNNKKLQKYYDKIEKYKKLTILKSVSHLN